MLQWRTASFVALFPIPTPLFSTPFFPFGGTPPQPSYRRCFEVQLLFRRGGDWAGLTFIESLSTTTVAFFYLAVALYAILLFPNTLALVNQFWMLQAVLALLSIKAS